MHANPSGINWELNDGCLNWLSRGLRVRESRREGSMAASVCNPGYEQGYPRISYDNVREHIYETIFYHHAKLRSKIDIYFSIKSCFSRLK